MAVRLVRLCPCGHARADHQHYRRGSDCGSCDCARYRRGWSLTVSWRAGAETRAVSPERVEEVAGPFVRPTHLAPLPATRPATGRPRVVAPRLPDEAPAERTST